MPSAGLSRVFIPLQDRDVLQTLARFIFPRWSFFDRVSTPLSVDVKAGSSEWQTIDFHAERTKWSLLSNGSAILLHAERSLIENFVQELPNFIVESQVDIKTIDAADSFRMMIALVRTKTRAQFRIENSASLQFRIRACTLTGEEVVFVSHLFPASAVSVMDEAR